MRTRMQQDADRLDLDLSRALSKAEGLAEAAKPVPTERSRWWLVCDHLRQARSQTRGAMHPDDRKQTS